MFKMLDRLFTGGFKTLWTLFKMAWPLWIARHQDKLVTMGLQQIRCFGSVARGKATWGSDVDLLVLPRSEVLERLSCFDLASFQRDIGEILGGYPVDLTVDRDADSFRTAEIAARALAEVVVVWRAP